jgi:hypothetical protein
MSTLIKPKTNIAQVREQQKNQMQQVCEWLGWTEQQYCEHQFEQYELFLQEMWGKMPEALQQFRLSPIFRGFWNNDWAMRTATDFLPYVHTDFDDHALEDEYIFIHWHSRLVRDPEFIQRYINATKYLKG